MPRCFCYRHVLPAHPHCFLIRFACGVLNTWNSGAPQLSFEACERDLLHNAICDLKKGEGVEVIETGNRICANNY